MTGVAATRPTAEGGHAVPVMAETRAVHEEAAHERRNWVRLTFDCNNRCIFCLDSDSLDGDIRDREDIRRQIVEGRDKGATRLILSGGEPTIHPRFIEFVRLGKRLGYRKVQTVTNGRLFAYPEFLRKALDAGLDEITFSLHGPNARVHDALVGVKGAWEQEVEGLRNALADGRPVVNIDMVINRGNVRHLPEMMRLYTQMGVREFDLLQVVPFGRAFTEGRETLFYDLEEARPYLLEAFAYARKPGMHIWLNRFPPQHLEGFEDLIQDPYKLNDEVRGRKEQFERLLDAGVPLDCREPARCKHCYLEPLCDTLDEVREVAAEARFEVLRVDPTFEATLPPEIGGDPASAKWIEAQERMQAEAAASGEGEAGRRSRMGLPIVTVRPPAPAVSLPELAARAGARALWVVAADLGAALAEAERFPGLAELELELASYAGLAEALGDGDRLGDRRLVRALAADAAQAAELLAVPGAFEVALALTKESAAWVLGLEAAPARLVLRQPTYERVTEALERDVEPASLFPRLPPEVPVEGVPRCISGRAPRPRPAVLDGAMTAPSGRLEIFRYARRFIASRFVSKSLRCRGCAFFDACEGVHVNYARAHGYGVLQPVPATEGGTS